MTIISLYSQKKWRLDWTLISLGTISLGIFLFSVHQQYVKRINPCSLCEWQRYIYFSIFVIAPFGQIQRFNSAVRGVINIILFISICLAAYHALVQLGFLTDRCTMTNKIENVNDFMNMLEQPKTPCANIGWKFFGLSASIYNVILSFNALIILNFKYLKRLIYV